MEGAEYQRLLRIGLGRAVLHLENHDDAPYRDAIVHACLHNLALDRQVEGSRAQYMVDVVQHTQQPQFYMDKAFEALLNVHLSPDNFVDYDVQQLFDFAQILAALGDTRAREVLYEAYTKNLTPNDPPGADAIADLDGVTGFLFILKSLEKFPIADISFADLRVILTFSLEEHLGAEAVKLALDEAAQHDEWIATCMQIIWGCRNPKRRSESEREAQYKISYAELKQEILDTNNYRRISMGRWREWGKLASERDLRCAARDLLAVPDDQTEQILAYLAIFGRRRFPLEIDRILAWASLLDDRDFYKADSALADRIPFWAYNVLLNITHPKIRVLALDLIENPNANVSGRAVGLLAQNYQHGDWHLIAQLTSRDLDDEDYHSLGFSVGDVFEMYPVKDAVPALLNLYERNPCGQCREKIVERLHWLGALPDWMIAECKFDSNLYLREAIVNNFA